MKLSEFDFDLPEELIATRPVKPRSSARLLVAEGDEIRDHIVRNLVDILRPGDRLVLNDTKVIPARLTGFRHRQSDLGETSAKIEVTLLQPEANGTWSALVKPLKKVRETETITFSDALSAQLVEKRDGQARLHFNLKGDDFDRALDHMLHFIDAS